MSNEKILRNQLRQQILQTRRSLSVKDSYEAGLNILKKLESLELFNRKITVASYVSLQGELCTQDINDYLMTRHHLCLPFMVLNEKGKMDFYSFKKGDLLIENRFHILEPEDNQDNFVPPQNLDAIIVPLVAFDEMGNRLGMGGGYYDRMLKKIRQDCITIGVAYEFQKLDKVPIEEWDMPLDYVITEKSIYKFSR